jgi:hypothetical protein
VVLSTYRDEKGEPNVDTNHLTEVSGWRGPTGCEARTPHPLQQAENFSWLYTKTGYGLGGASRDLGTMIHNPMGN